MRVRLKPHARISYRGSGYRTLALFGHDKRPAQTARPPSLGNGLQSTDPGQGG